MPNPPSSSPQASDNAGGRVAGSYLQPLLEAAEARGVTPVMLARAAGLPENALDALPESLSARDYVRLMDAGAELANDPHFGLHVGERVKLGTYNVYGLILLSCRDFGQALQQTMRFEGLAHDLGRSDLSVDGGMAEYRWKSAIPQASRHLAESVFAGIRVFGNWLAGQPLPAADLAFAHAEPADTSEHERIFGGKIRFGAAVHAARFDAALLSWPVPNADIGLYPVLQQHAEQLLREKERGERAAREGSIVAQVRSAIVRNLAQDRVRLPLIAEELSITQRTLQRKLKEAGVSFQQVLDQIRSELAQDYLKQGNLSISEIAFLLGFQEQSSFNHAFKEWTGVNPGAWRGKAVN
jgi:AraC-like DNA-binding protein